MLVQAAAAAAGGQQYPAAALYVVATPIGNLSDLSFRALHVLATVDAIACEDTRHSARLLEHFGLTKPLLAAHEHNERDAAAAVLARLGRGERVAYISDAGTPAVSDPGATLVAAARDAGFRVVPIPGASSALAALSVAGDMSGAGFAVVGFLPARGAERDASAGAVRRGPADPGAVRGAAPHRGARRGAWRSLPRAQAHRLPRADQAVRDRGHLVGERPGGLAGRRPEPRPGRIRRSCCTPSRTQDASAGEADHDALLAPLLAALPLKQAVALAAEIGGAPRNLLYARALVLKAEARPKAARTERAGPAAQALDRHRRHRPARRASVMDVPAAAGLHLGEMAALARW